jgi:16S rRNA (cytosine1402-N4)-methyltransferase
MSKYHEPVLLNEAIDLLDPRPDKNFIDCTLGGGGHAEEILKRNGAGKLLGIDLDRDAVTEVKQKLKKYQGRTIIIQGNFANLKNIVNKNDFTDISGILLDLGVSFHQLATARRGFSYRLEGELDMRMGAEMPISARELIKEISQSELKIILENFGEIKGAEKISNKIIDYRKTKEIVSTLDLIEAVLKTRTINKYNLKFISQIFQAIRIAVNSELENLKSALIQALEILLPGGRLAVISYHSLEDRIVKNYFRKESRNCVCPDDIIQCQCSHRRRLKIITKKPIRPSRDEIIKNKKSRSAKLRAIIKI